MIYAKAVNFLIEDMTQISKINSLVLTVYATNANMCINVKGNVTGGLTMELKPCPLCGGEIDERGGQCNYGKRIMTLDLKCKKCGTIFKFKSNWLVDPYSEAIEEWNRMAGNKTS